MIDLSARFLKQDVRTPEALYFAFPLNMPADWKAHFDTAGIPTELDTEQIPGSCRDWVTVDTFASVHRPDFGVTLYCPDAPLVQIGNFNFAKKQKSIPRQSNPVLLAWPVNNYWETNFRASQPGKVELRYSFVSHGKFDSVRAWQEGQQACNPPVTHPVFDSVAPRQGKFLDVQGSSVVITYVKPAANHEGIVLRLINLGDKANAARIAIPGRAIRQAYLCGTLEDSRASLAVVNGSVTCDLSPRQLTTICLLSE